jgi:hypothetical protein
MLEANPSHEGGAKMAGLDLHSQVDVEARYAFSADSGSIDRPQEMFLVG